MQRYRTLRVSLSSREVVLVAEFGGNYRVRFHPDYGYRPLAAPVVVKEAIAAALFPANRVPMAGATS